MTRRPTGDPDVADVIDAHRYEVRAGSALGGFAEYTVAAGSGAHIVFTHTEITPALRGQGLASRLVKAALDDARGRGLTVVPVCPFVARWIRLHPEYADLVNERAAAPDP